MGARLTASARSTVAAYVSAAASARATVAAYASVVASVSTAVTTFSPPLTQLLLQGEMSLCLRELGIRDIESPDWGEPQNLQADEVAMFWACGVTSHSALLRARLSMAITHAPGAMLITDLPADHPPPT